ncbi:hypothetical protein HDU82_008126, partial [Entophlyctis luteolus]
MPGNLETHRPMFPAAATPARSGDGTFKLPCPPTPAQISSLRENPPATLAPSDPPSPLKRALLSSASPPARPSPTAGAVTGIADFAGSWENPKLRKVQELARMSMLTDTDASRLISNSVALACCALAWMGGYIQYGFGESHRIDIYWDNMLRETTAYPAFRYTSFIGLLVLLTNVATIIPKLFRKPPNQLGKLSLTQRERVLMGVEKSDPAKQPTSLSASKNAPHYTPSKSVFRSDKPESSMFSTPITRGGLSKSNSGPNSGVPTSANVSTPIQSTQFLTPSTESALSTPLRIRKPVYNSPQIRDKEMLQKLLDESDFLGSSTPSTPQKYLTPLQYGSNIARTPGSAKSSSFTTPVSAIPVSDVGKYQPASAAKSMSDSVSGKAGAMGTSAGDLGGPGNLKRDRFEGGYLVKDAHTVVAGFLGIEAQLEASWGEKMRWWVGEKVVKPLAARCAKTDAELAAQGCEHLGCGVAVWAGGVLNPVAGNANTAAPTGSSGIFGFGSSLTGSGGLFGQKPTGSLGQNQFGGGFFGQSTSTAPSLSVTKPATLWDFQQHFGQTALCQERLKLEQYLLIPEYANCRLYIYERIQELAKSGGLALYKWNGLSGPQFPHSSSLSSSLSTVVIFFSSTTASNSAFKRSVLEADGYNTNQSYPSDAEIVVHLVS